MTRGLCPGINKPLEVEWNTKAAMAKPLNLLILSAALGCNLPGYGTVNINILAKELEFFPNLTSHFYGYVSVRQVSVFTGNNPTYCTSKYGGHSRVKPFAHCI
jgi:hypothetical protein